MNRNSLKGFSLPEILVVVTIIGILAGLLLPALSAVQNRMVRTRCKNNLRQINLAFAVFATDHSMKYPWCLPKRDLKQMGFSYYGAWDTRQLYGNGIIRTMLGTAEVLVSPCDPERKEKNDLFMPEFRFTDEVPSEVCSYGIGVGTPLERVKGDTPVAQEYCADFTHSETILTITRNIQGPINDGDSLSNQSGRNPILVPPDFTKSATWVGIDDPNRDLANKRGMANLKGGMGQMGLADGSAHMFNLADLAHQILLHHRDQGVTYRGIPSPIIDTPNDDIPGKHSDFQSWNATHGNARERDCAACGTRIVREEDVNRYGTRVVCPKCYRKILQREPK